MRRVSLFFLLGAFFLLVSAGPADAETTWYKNTSPLGLDARSLGMGGACLAVAEAGMWPANPAGLAFYEGQEGVVGRFVNPLIDSVLQLGDQTYLNLGYFHGGTDSSGYGLMAYENRYYWGYVLPDPSVDHYYTDLKGLQYGYGYRLNDRLGLGFNLRAVDQLDTTSDVDFTNTYFAFDAGAFFRLNSAVSAAVLVMDLNAPRIYAEFGGERYYAVYNPQIVFGGAVRFGDFFLAAVDMEVKNGFTNGDELLLATRLGLEVRPFPFFAFRLGTYHGQMTVGLGLKLGRPEDLQLSLDFGQYWPEGDGYLHPVQAVEMRVSF